MIAGAGYRDSVPHLVADPACAERDGAEPVLYCIIIVYCTLFIHCTALYCTVLYCTVCTVLYCTVLYCTVLYCAVLYCNVLYCTVLYCAGRVLASREPAAVQLGPGDGVPAEQEDQHHLRHQPLGLAHLHPAVG